MSWSFNPFTGNLDLVGSGGGTVVFEGEVETFAELPETVGDPAVGASFLVRSSTGVWLVSRKQAGIWIRRYDTGVRATDWEYGGDYPVNSVNGQTGNVSLTAGDVGAVSGLETRSHDFYSNSTYTLAQGRNVQLNVGIGAIGVTGTITLPRLTTDGAQNGDDVFIAGQVGVSANTTLIIERYIWTGSSYISSKETVVTATTSGAWRFRLLSGVWTLQPVATHTHPASAITSGTFDNARVNFAAPDSIGSTTRNSGAFTTLNATNGTITASAPVLDLSQTWNNAGVTFTGLRFNATNTASAAASLLADFQVGGTSQFSVSRAGTVTMQGNLITSATSVIQVGNSPRITLDGTDGTFLALHANHEIRWATGRSDQATANPSLILARDGANDVLAQRRTTNPQTFRLYNTFTDASNHERGFMRWSSNVLQIGTEKAGTGSARALEFQTDGTTRLTITSGGSVIHGLGNGVIGWSASTLLRPVSGNGTLVLYNNAQNDFNRLQFGGTDANFPALKRSSTTLQVRLADDSGYTVMDAQLRAQGTAPATSGAAGTAGDIRYDADYIYVCTAASTWKRAAIATW